VLFYISFLNQLQVAAGGTFCLALTAQGRVVVWGKLPVGEVPSPAEVETLDVPVGGAAHGGEILTGARR